MSWIIQKCKEKLKKLGTPPQGAWDLEYFQNQASEGGFSANFLSIFTFSGGKKTFLAKSIKHNLGNIFGSGYISIPRGGEGVREVWKFPYFIFLFLLKASLTKLPHKGCDHHRCLILWFSGHHSPGGWQCVARHLWCRHKPSSVAHGPMTNEYKIIELAVFSEFSETLHSWEV